MKKYIPLLAIAVMSVFSCFLPAMTNAQTTISSASQSGIWTLSGSPYIITTSINVPANQTLRIEAGVHVQFQQFCQFDITGSLIAHGTDSLPIIFESTDTTGWYNDMIGAGGWHGIHFNQFQGTADSSEFVHCIVRDCKHGTVGNWNGIEALFVYRTLKVDSCEFYHNQSSYNMAEGVTILIQGGGSFEMSNSSIHDNYNRVCALRIGTGNYEPINIHHCHIYNNSSGAAVWAIQSNLLFEYNEVNDNSSIYDMSAICITGFRAVIRHNIIHNNVSENEAAVTGFEGKITIDDNLICNNHHTSGSCGLVDGGGGIHAMLNGASSWDSTRYYIRNNIIANNYSPYYGGGIYCYNTVVYATNNHIINNSAYFGGSGIYALGNLTDVHLQNNLFFNNCNYLGMTGNIQLSSIHLISYVNNWSEYEIPANIVGTATIFSGDTTHNVVGINPLMINPTQTCAYTDSALSSNFNLQASSGCIDAGDSLGSFHTTYDYLGNWRMMGNSIDIGAYEQIGEIINSTEENFQNEISLYPNPVTDQLTIFSQETTTTKNEDWKFVVTDVFGKIALSSDFANLSFNQKIDVSSLPAGIYFIKISDRKKIFTEKFVKL
ncbi:MAG TPA: hypothetical protein DCQ93_06880 [Bacteroidetes bacterium]|nr:hypothetical protein [Bacteroidota bacterium]